MTTPIRPAEQPPGERRTATRGRHHLLMDLLFRVLRAALGRANSVRAAVGIVLLMGIAIAGLATWGFAELAGHIRQGETQAFDEAILYLLREHRIAWVERSLLEITALGTGLVVSFIVGISAMFLWLSNHRYSASLLLLTSVGGILLNNVLKLTFSRPRPRIIEWPVEVATSSFPSGHSMSAATVYVTVAYLAARLMSNSAARIVTMLAAIAVILLIGASRVYLGVHYPSDVLGGYVIGIAWVAFCMATLEAVQLWARRNAPREMRHEEPAPERHEAVEA